MALKLGELLVEKGLITRSQLEDGLRAQQIYSGKLGTNLVEQGYLSQSALAEFLSVQLGLPNVEASRLEAVPQDVLAIVPRELAEQHLVVPVEVDKKSLLLAMADPTDLGMIDDLGFQTGYTILPAVAPELLITFALERHYGIVRKCRYLRLSGIVDQEFEVVHETSELEEAAPKVAEAPADYEGEILEVSTYSTSEIARDLAAAENQNDVYRVLHGLFARDFDRSVAFSVQGAEVRGYFQLGCTLPDAELRRIRFPVQETLWIRQACESRSISVGTPPDSGGLSAVAAQIGFSPGPETLTVPILVNNQVRIVVLADGNKVDPISVDPGRYEDFRKKMSYAVQMVSLRARILE